MDILEFVATITEKLLAVATPADERTDGALYALPEPFAAAAVESTYVADFRRACLLLMAHAQPFLPELRAGAMPEGLPNYPGILLEDLANFYRAGAELVVSVYGNTLHSQTREWLAPFLSQRFPDVSEQLNYFVQALLAQDFEEAVPAVNGELQLCFCHVDYGPRPALEVSVITVEESFYKERALDVRPALLEMPSTEAISIIQQFVWLSQQLDVGRALIQRARKNLAPALPGISDEAAASYMGQLKPGLSAKDSDLLRKVMPAFM